MGYFNSNEGNSRLFKQSGYFGSNVLISLEFDGKVDALGHEVLRISKRNLGAIAILNFDKVNGSRCRSPTQSLCECAAKTVVGLRGISHTKAFAIQNPDIRSVLSAVAAAEKALLLQGSQQPETDSALKPSVPRDLNQRESLSVVIEHAQDIACAGHTLKCVG